MGHQIKGGPTLLLTASVQVCNWTEQRADTLTLKKGDRPDVYRFRQRFGIYISILLIFVDILSDNI